MLCQKEGYFPSLFIVFATKTKLVLQREFANKEVLKNSSSFSNTLISQVGTKIISAPNFFKILKKSAE